MKPTPAEIAAALDALAAFESKLYGDLSDLAAVLQRPQTAETLALYAKALAMRVKAQPWDEAMADWRLAAPWTHFPALPALFAAYQARVDAAEGRRPVEVEAVDAYTRVLQAGSYSPEGGTTWTYRGVLDRCGKAAAEAFLAAGGDEVWREANDYRAEQRRSAFLAAYIAAAREQPEARLLPWSPERAPQLAAGAEVPQLATRTEAREVLRRLDPVAVAPKPERPKCEVVNLDRHADRLALLRRQAAQIVADESASEGAGRV